MASDRVINADVEINGGISVDGATAEFATTNLVINKDEAAAGTTSTITVERAAANDALLRWNEATDVWEMNDGTGYKSIASTDVVVAGASDGLMAHASKTKLDTIATSANLYVLPTAGAATLGGVHVEAVATSNLEMTGMDLSVTPALATQAGVTKHTVTERYTVTNVAGITAFTTTYAMELLDTTNTADVGPGNYDLDEYRNVLWVYLNVALTGTGAVLCDYGAAADKYHYVQTDGFTITLGAVAAQNDIVTIIYVPA